MDSNDPLLRARLRIARTENGAGSVPELAEARRQAATDPELAEILAAEERFDQMVAEKLRAGMPVPAELRAQILAMDVSRTVAPAKSLLRPARIWAFPAVLAAAAVVALGAAAFFQARMQPAPSPSSHGDTALAVDPLSSLVVAVAQHLGNPPEYEFRGTRLNEVQAYLAANAAPAPRKIPVALRELPTEGCTTFQVDNHRVTMITFAGEKPLRMFVVHRGEFPGCAERYRPVIERVANRAVAAWTCSTGLYFVTCDGGEDDLSVLF